MRPIKLEIEGLNSFSARQVIDFEAVLREGIFGIFGNTGSGKSTILDAITLALYGRTQKKNSKDEFVNCNSKKAVVDFTFSILCEGRRRTFKFFREIYPGKRAGNAFVYEYEGDKKLLLEDKADNVTRLAERVVGLKYDDFNKCIALPQGEFAQFTKSTGTERLDIVARLFSLEKYGAELYAKASARASGYEAELGELSAELNTYAEYGEEREKELSEKIGAEEERISALKKERAEAEETLRAAKEAFSLQKELSETEAKLAALAAREKEIAEMKKKTEIFADIERFCEAEEDLEKAEKELSQAKIKLEKLGQKSAELTEKEKRFASDDFAALMQKKSEELLERRALLGNLEADISEQETAKAALRKLREEYRAEDAEQKKLKEKCRAAEERLRANEELAALLGEEKDLFVEATAGARAQAVRNEYLFLQGEYERNRSEEAWLKKIIEEKLQSGKIESADFSSIEKLIEEEKKKNAERKRVSEARIKLSEEYRAALAKAEVKENKIADMLLRGEELKTAYEKKRAAVERVTGGEDYKTLKARVEKELAELRQSEERRKAEETQLREQIHAVTSETALLRSQIENLNKKIYENAEKSKEILGKCGIMEKDIAFSMRMSEKERAHAAKEIALYEREKAVCGAKASEAKARLGGRSVREEELAVAEKECEGKRAEEDDLAKALHEDRLLLKINAEKSGKKAELLKREKALTEKYALAKLLQNLVKKRAFLDYVANEYLEDITRAAAATLLRLTSGGYGLVYEGEFFVTDNKNGGKKRSVSTLSGGETFLVSLSLAFSLSTYICAKSDRPIEFFFLDEGFGTLDSELVETVLDSLEKFKSEKFSIGIISHVKELKERIGCRITVKAATESAGSEIEITY